MLREKGEYKMGKWIDYALGFCILVMSFRLYRSTGDIYLLWQGLAISLLALHLIVYYRQEKKESNQALSPASTSVKRRLGMNQKWMLTGIAVMMISIAIFYISEKYQLSAVLSWGALTIQLIVTCIAGWYAFHKRNGQTNK